MKLFFFSYFFFFALSARCQELNSKISQPYLLGKTKDRVNISGLINSHLVVVSQSGGSNYLSLYDKDSLNLISNNKIAADDQVGQLSIEEAIVFNNQLFVLGSKQSGSRKDLYLQKLTEDGKIVKTLFVCNVLPNKMKKHSQKDFEVLNYKFLVSPDKTKMAVVSSDISNGQFIFSTQVVNADLSLEKSTVFSASLSDEMTDFEDAILNNEGEIYVLMKKWRENPSSNSVKLKHNLAKKTVEYFYSLLALNTSTESISELTMDLGVGLYMVPKLIYNESMSTILCAGFYYNSSHIQLERFSHDLECKTFGGVFSYKLMADNSVNLIRKQAFENVPDPNEIFGFGLFLSGGFEYTDILVKENGNICMLTELRFLWDLNKSKMGGDRSIPNPTVPYPESGIINESLGGITNIYHCDKIYAFEMDTLGKIVAENVVYKDQRVTRHIRPYISYIPAMHNNELFVYFSEDRRSYRLVFQNPKYAVLKVAKITNEHKIEKKSLMDAFESNAAIYTTSSCTIDNATYLIAYRSRKKGEKFNYKIVKVSY